MVVEETAPVNGAASWPGDGARRAPTAGAQDAAPERAVVAWLRTRVTDDLAAHTTAGGPAARWVGADRRAWATDLVRAGLRDYTRAAVADGRTPFPPQAEDRITRAVLDSLFGLGGLQPLLDDPGVENINANGADRVFIRRTGGHTDQVEPVADSDEDLIDLIRTAAARAGVGERRFDAGHPILNLQLPDGSRLFAVMDVARRPCVSIRRHRLLQVTLAELVRVGTVTPALAAFLAAAVRARRNILICGCTGAGKTTLLRALAAEIGPGERLVTIEDTYELLLDHDTTAHPDCVALQVREPNIEDAGGIDQAELVRHALRMSADRVIVGEVRGAELVPMLNAMSQGTDGSMGTVHASSSRGVFTKLAAYGAQAPERLGLDATNLLLAEAVHLVVHLAFDRTAARRVVSSVLEVTGADGPLVTANEVFRPGPGAAAIAATPPSTALMDILVEAGYRGGPPGRVVPDDGVPDDGVPGGGRAGPR